MGRVRLVILNLNFTLCKKPKKMFTVSVCILTNRRFDRLARAVQSVALQADTSPFPFSIHIVVNTQDAAYEEAVRAWAATGNERAQPFVHASLSNGCPGRGHNAVLNVFAETLSATHEWCIMLDGDDEFYPGAFALLYRAMIHTPIADVLVLAGTDCVTDKLQRGALLCDPYRLNASTTAHGEDNPFAHAGSTCNPFLSHNDATAFTMSTAGRVLAFRRAGALAIRYDENARLFDDVSAFVLAVHHHHHLKTLHVAVIATRGIYLYGMICDDVGAASTAFQREAATKKNICVEEEKRAVAASIEVARAPWGEKAWDATLAELPFIAVEQPPLPSTVQIEQKLRIAMEYVVCELDFMRVEARRAFDRGDHDRAIELLSKLHRSVVSAADEADVLLGLGMNAEKAGRPWEALSYWRRSVLVKPTAPAYMRMVFQLTRVGCFTEALHNGLLAMELLAHEHPPTLDVEDCSRFLIKVAAAI